MLQCFVVCVTFCIHLTPNLKLRHDNLFRLHVKAGDHIGTISFGQQQRVERYDHCGRYENAQYRRILQENIERAKIIDHCRAPSLYTARLEANVQFGCEIFALGLSVRRVPAQTSLIGIDDAVYLHSGSTKCSLMKT